MPLVPTGAALVLMLAAIGGTPPAAGAPSPAAAPARPSLTLGSGRNSVHAQGYTLHYSAIPTMALSEAVAREAGILRSSNRALLNVALRKGRAAEAMAVAARIEANATNASGRRQALRLREVREGDAIYYLGEASIDERDVLSIDLVATPLDGGPPIRAMFAQEFWPDGATPR